MAIAPRPRLANYPIRWRETGYSNGRTLARPNAVKFYFRFSRRRRRAARVSTAPNMDKVKGSGTCRSPNRASDSLRLLPRLRSVLHRGRFDRRAFRLGIGKQWPAVGVFCQAWIQESQD